jgi:hypothetical protein
MKTSLDYKKHFLCVLTESEISDGARGTALVREWHPVHRAEKAETLTLLGRPVTELNSDEGIYIDEEGNVFQLAEKGRSKPMEIEQSARERGPAGADGPTSANGRTPKEGNPSEGAAGDNHGDRVRQQRTPKKKAKRRPSRAESANDLGALMDDGAAREDTTSQRQCSRS